MIETNFIHPSLPLLIAAALVALWPGRNTAWRFVPVLAAVAAFLCLFTMRSGFYGHFTYLGVDITLGRVDKLSVVFAHVFTLAALIGFIFSLHLEKRYQHIAASFYVAGALGCVFSADFLSLFIFWELMSVASTFLIWLNNKPSSTRAGFRYFLFHTLGGLFLLAGLLLRYGAVGSFAFTPIDPASAMYYDWLILIGFCVNAAVVPLHAWLPDAYPEGSVTGSVFMSAFTTKTAVYVLCRGFAGWEVLAVAGAIMAVYGVCYATIENNARRILSYHIISQVGYMVCGIGIGTAMTLNGAAAHAYAHILYKGLLFMSTGVLLYACGTAKLTELGGLAARLPWVMVCYVIAGLSISGMPLFNGFISKTMTIAGVAANHNTTLALMLEIAAVGTFLSVGIKLPYFAFWSKSEDNTRPLRPIPVNMYIAMFIGAALCTLQGLYPDMLYNLLPYNVEPVSHSSHPVTPAVIANLAQVPVVAFHPWNIDALFSSLLLLGSTGLGFYFMRTIVMPHPSRNLDFDWLYRKISTLAFAALCIPLALLDSIWTSIYRTTGLKSLLAMAKGAQIIDKKIIDGIVDGIAYFARDTGHSLARVQTGRLQDYLALAMILALGIFALIWFI